MNLTYWEWALPPCQISDELYYVGTKHGPSHLLDTGDGFLLIDTGFPQNAYMILENIRELGFNPYQIKHIVHTHAHVDHMGSTRAITSMTGAKTWLGKGDEDAASGKNDLAYYKEYALPFLEPFVPDFILYDEQIVKFGNVEILFLSTPGHTDGTLSLFLDLHWQGKTYRGGMFGGAGLNTLSKEYLSRHSLPVENREKYLTSLDRLSKQKVKIHLGNHLSDNKHLDKMQRLGEKENPFIDLNSWSNFLFEKRRTALEFFKNN